MDFDKCYNELDSLNEMAKERVYRTYVIFYRYDRGEQYDVYYVGHKLADAKKQYNEEVVKFFSYGPDDVSQLWFVEMALDKAQLDWINGLVGKDMDSSDHKLFDYYFGNGWEQNDDVIKKVIYRMDGGLSAEEILEEEGYDLEELEEQGIDAYDMFNEDGDPNPDPNKLNWDDMIRKHVCPF